MYIRECVAPQMLGLLPRNLLFGVTPPPIYFYIAHNPSINCSGPGSPTWGSGP